MSINLGPQTKGITYSPKIGNRINLDRPKPKPKEKPTCPRFQPSTVSHINSSFGNRSASPRSNATNVRQNPSKPISRPPQLANATTGKALRNVKVHSTPNKNVANTAKVQKTTDKNVGQNKVENHHHDTSKLAAK